MAESLQAPPSATTRQVAQSSKMDRSTKKLKTGRIHYSIRPLPELPKVQSVICLNAAIYGLEIHAKLYNTSLVNVSVIGYWNLSFVWNLVFVIWDFNPKSSDATRTALNSP